MGAHTKLNEEVRYKLLQLVENGNYIEVAAAAVGITSHTFRKWRKRGQELIDLYPDLDPDDYPENVVPSFLTPHEWLLYRFEDEMQIAEAKAEAYAVLAVRKQMPSQWTAAMTFLERRHPDRWRKRQTLDLPGQGTGGIDERALIEDPQAMRLLHEALEAVAKGQAVDSTAVEISDRELPAQVEDLDGQS